MNVTVDCNSRYIIYMVFDLVCLKTYVGYTTDAAKDRFANHKSHIKCFRKTCTVVRHFIDCKDSSHILNRNSQSEFDIQLAKQLQFQIIDQVKIPHGSTKDQIKSIMLNCEADWQSQLRTTRDEGGLNARNSRSEMQTLDSQS